MQPREMSPPDDKRRMCMWVERCASYSNSDEFIRSSAQIQIQIQMKIQIQIQSKCLHPILSTRRYVQTIQVLMRLYAVLRDHKKYKYMHLIKMSLEEAVPNTGKSSMRRRYWDKASKVMTQNHKCRIFQELLYACTPFHNSKSKHYFATWSLVIRRDDIVLGRRKVAKKLPIFKTFSPVWASPATPALCLTVL